MSNWAVEVENLTVVYDKTPVLWDVDLKLPPGQLTCIIGPNGAGKTTLIQAMLGLVTPADGKVWFNGRDYDCQQQNIGYVPQRESVDWDFPTTVLDIVLMGCYSQLGWLSRPGEEEKTRAKQALEKVNMLDYQDRQISQLSGGQQQRVFLARALVQDAVVYLMDEPFQGVDAKTEKAIVSTLKEFKEQGKTVVVVHHDLQTIADYFDWAVLLNKVVVASGPLEQVVTESNLKTTYQGQVESFYHLKAVD